MRLAIAARIWESGRSSYSTPGRIGAVTVAASTSRRMIRPPGPLPRISRRSTPVCAAIFFARGDALTRPVAAAVGAVRAGAGSSARKDTRPEPAPAPTVATTGAAGPLGTATGAAGGAEPVSFPAEAPPAPPAPAAAGKGPDRGTPA